MGLWLVLDFQGAVQNHSAGILLEETHVEPVFSIVQF